MKLIIEDDEGRKTVVPLVRDEISIGRLDGNTIRLTERNVSRKHARILRQNGSITIEDLGSYNGVWINGEKIAARAPVKEGDLIEIGDYDLALEGSAAQEADTNPTAKLDEVVPSPSRTPPLGTPAPAASPAPSPVAARSAPAPVPVPVRTAAAPPVRPASPAPVRVPAPPAPARHEPPPAAHRSAEGATAVVRLSDLQKPTAADGARELAAHDRPRIVALTGTFRGMEFPLKRTLVKFGRTEEGNDIVVDHASISRQHGWFQLEGGTWKIYDNKSANGIRINGDEYGMSPVRSGDVIELGHVKFKFVGANETFILPREAEAPAAVPQGMAAAPAKGSKTPLFIGVGVAVVAVVVATVVVVHFLKSKPVVPAATDDSCAKGESAYVAQSWNEAVPELRKAQALGSKCSFPLAQMLSQAIANQQAQKALDEATAKFEAKRYSSAIGIVKAANFGTGTVVESKLRDLARKARTEGASELIDEANKAIDQGRVGDANDALKALNDLDPENPAIAEIKARMTKRVPSNRPPSRPPPTQAPSSKPSLQERNTKALQLLEDGNNQIKSGQINQGIATLHKIVALQPGKAYLCKAYRNMGVGWARLGNTKNAIREYKSYLRCDPNAPERAQIQAIIAKYGG